MCAAADEPQEEEAWARFIALQGEDGANNAIPTYIEHPKQDLNGLLRSNRYPGQYTIEYQRLPMENSFGWRVELNVFLEDGVGDKVLVARVAPENLELTRIGAENAAAAMLLTLLQVCAAGSPAFLFTNTRIVSKEQYLWV